jgi:hypothetical protein
MLTTRTSKLAVVLLVVVLVWTPAAFAWSWPVEGPVLQPFSYDAAQPYAAGQHRGVDIGADSAGETVVAPAAGTISFAGTVPTNGKSVTIQTADGYSVTLTHLGSIAVAKGQAVAERDPIGVVGPSGTAEEDVPYVHLGIRVTSDPEGYVDPLSFLPALASGGESDGSAPAQPGSSGSSSATPVKKSTPAAPTVASKHGSTTASSGGHVSQEKDKSAQEPSTDVRARPSARRPAVPDGKSEGRLPHPVGTQQRRPVEPSRVLRRPVVEAAVPAEPVALDAGHETHPGAQPSPGRAPTALVSLLLNGAAALVSLAAAFAATRARRRRLVDGAQVLDLPRPSARHRLVSRAA